MPTIATLPPRATTNVAQVFTCRNARNLQITISVAGVYLSFAEEQDGIIGGFGPEEFHAPELLVINDESIGAVSFRSAVSGVPATIVIIASR